MSTPSKPDRPMRFVRSALVVLIIICTSLFTTASAAPGLRFGLVERFSSTGHERAPELRNPLDPLTPNEYRATVAILRRANKVDDDSRFPIISLHQPDKQWVLTKWRPGKQIGRESFAVVKQGARTFEAIIDLTNRKIKSWREKVGIQPPILLEEVFGVQQIVLSSPEFLAALAKRGITDTSGMNLLCAPLSIGFFNIPEEQGRRLLRVPCFLTAGSSTNLFARPIEGLFALVDLNTHEILKITDTGVRPIPPNDGEFSPEAIGRLRPPLKPVVISQPQGSNIKVDGHTISWDRWTFHERLDKRDGLIISQVKYQDGDTLRPIMYEGSLSDIFVPYQDPDVGWYWRTFMDSGEYGFGASATPLTPGIDCPTSATFLDGVLNDDQGNPFSAANVICIFERPTGDPAWRHFEAFTGAFEGRPEHELVTRMIATIGNYDYILDWIFAQDGRVRIRIGATGIDITKGVVSTSLDDPTAEQDTAYGTLVAPNLVLPNHDHYFNFRLDLDVDGTKNAFELSRLVPKRIGNSPRTSLWQVESELVQTESQARLDYDPANPTMWEVVNRAKTSPMGHHPGYSLIPQNSAIQNLMSPDDWPVRRAAFSEHNLWVTPYHPGERNAGGFYVNQSDGTDGLGVWSQRNRPLVDTDIVLWYTAGLHHQPHLEDWPVMPTVWLEFDLVPHNFFARNPALDLAKPR